MVEDEMPPWETEIPEEKSSLCPALVSPQAS